MDAHMPHFRNDGGDNMAQHLRYFYEFIPKMGVHHEYILMKLFIMSLEGDTRKWYRRLPPSTISFLKYFHTIFCDYHRCLYPIGLLDFDCCEHYDDNNHENKYDHNNEEPKMDNES